MRSINGMVFGMWWAWIPGLVILGFLIWIGVKQVSRDLRVAPQGTQAALEILKERYARGVINRDEFAEKKKDIS